MKRKVYEKLSIMLLCTILAAFSLLNTITHKLGFERYIYIAILVCILISTILLSIAHLKDDNPKFKNMN